MGRCLLSNAGYCHVTSMDTDPQRIKAMMDEAGVDQDQSWIFVPDDCRGTDLLQASVIIKRFGGSYLALQSFGPGEAEGPAQGPQ